MVRFEWDDEKARRNLSKHGVSFEEAQTVFDDDLARISSDGEHSVAENREIIAGRAESGRLLLVSFTSRGDATRLINARELTKSERKAYEEDPA